MKCNATGNPTPSIAWSMGAEVLPSGETLTIDNVYKFNSGMYSCTATNGVSPDAVGTANLTVNGKICSFYFSFLLVLLSIFF